MPRNLMRNEKPKDSGLVPVYVKEQKCLTFTVLPVVPGERGEGGKRRKMQNEEKVNGS